LHIYSFLSFNCVRFVALEACSLALVACSLRLLKNFWQLAR